MEEPRALSRVIAVGASAGGIEALRHRFAAIPDDLDAAFCVVLHIPARAPSVLAQILARAGPMPATSAVDGAPLVAGQIICATPDHHLIIRDGHVELTRGPKENGVRPAIDATFRSLALSYGRRAVGVILSGASTTAPPALPCCTSAAAPSSCRIPRRRSSAACRTWRSRATIHGGSCRSPSSGRRWRS